MTRIKKEVNLDNLIKLSNEYKINCISQSKFSNKPLSKEWNIEFVRLYLNEKMSFGEIEKACKSNGLKFNRARISSIIRKELEIIGVEPRTDQEAIRVSNNSLDMNKVFITEEITEWIDGFLLGDGTSKLGEKSEMTDSVEMARLAVASSQIQFTEYMMSGLQVYKPSNITFQEYNYECLNGSKGCYHSATTTHPDLAKQHRRWYPFGKKIVPKDVRLTPQSVLLWFLGDGYLKIGKTSCCIIISTDGFTKEDNEEVLVAGMKKLGFDCWINGENRFRISSDHVGKFFDFIGRKSPISCYDYKFEVPEWRYTHIQAGILRQNMGLNKDGFYDALIKHDIKTETFQKNGRLLLKNEDIQRIVNLCEEGLIRIGDKEKYTNWLKENQYYNENSENNIKFSMKSTRKPKIETQSCKQKINIVENYKKRF